MFWLTLKGAAVGFLVYLVAAFVLLPAFFGIQRLFRRAGLNPMQAEAMTRALYVAVLLGGLGGFAYWLATV